MGRGIAYGLRFSVPIFFMITGYYSYSKDNKWFLKKAFGILKMTFFTEIVYGLYNLIDKCFIYGYSQFVVGKCQHLFHSLLDSKPL